MKASLLAVLFSPLLTTADGAKQLRGHGVKRGLHTSDSHATITYPNGTVSVDGGHMIQEPQDLADNPGSIIWTGEGSKPDWDADGSEMDLGGLTCFSEQATVETPSGITTMKELIVGDRILVDSISGKFERVYAFAHRNPSRSAKFVTISTPEEVLELTPPHLVFLEGQNSPIRADSVKVGDVLRGAQQVVTKIGSVQRDGIYAPLTKSGTLLVNGFLSSNYVALQESSNVVLAGISTSLSHHTYVHQGMSPFRLYCGLSDKFCSTYNEDGMPPFVVFCIWLSRWVYAQNILLQVLYMAGFFVVTGFCCLLETPIGWVSATAILLIWRMNNKKNLDNELSGKRGIQSPISLR